LLLSLLVVGGGVLEVGLLSLLLSVLLSLLLSVWLLSVVVAAVEGGGKESEGILVSLLWRGRGGFSFLSFLSSSLSPTLSPSLSSFFSEEEGETVRERPSGVE